MKWLTQNEQVTTVMKGSLDTLIYPFSNSIGNKDKAKNG